MRKIIKKREFVILLFIFIGIGAVLGSYLISEDLTQEIETSPLNNDSFVISWCGKISESNYGIFFQIYNLNGTAMGDAITVDSGFTQCATYFNNGVSVSALNESTFAIAWIQFDKSDGENYLRFYNVNGNPISDIITISSESYGRDKDSGISVSALNESAVVVGRWDTYNNPQRVFFSVYNIDGSLILSETSAGGNYSVETQKYGVSVSALNESTFAIAWYEGDSQDVIFRVFDYHGNPFSDEVHASEEAGDGYTVSVSAISSESFVIGWYENIPKSEALKVRTYDSGGTRISDEINLGNVAGAARSSLSVSALNETAFVVGWYNALSSAYTFSIYDIGGTEITPATEADHHGSIDGYGRQNIISYSPATGIGFFRDIFVMSWIADEGYLGYWNAFNPDGTEADFSGPSIDSQEYSPNSEDDVDPLINLTFTIEATDATEIDTIILEYHDGTDWYNETMTNIGGDFFETNITLIGSETNYTYRYWANDSLGNSGLTENETIEVTWDCSWSVTPTEMEEVIGFFEDKFVGNITIENTGDANYTNNNCSITFTPSYNGFSATYLNLAGNSQYWSSSNRFFQYETPIIVNAGESYNWSTNFSFPSTTSPFTETPSIYLTSSITDSVDEESASKTTYTLIISQPNPLLYQNIITYPSTYIYLTPGNFNLSAYVRNLGGADTEATTAYNVSFNWTLDSALSSRISNGTTSAIYENLTNNSKQYLNLTISLTSDNLGSMTKGNINATVYSYGYDNNSELIINSGNQTLLSDEISILFLCYGTIDGTCVSSCGVGVDPDCVESTTTVNSGGGSGGTQTESLSSSKDLQLVRGELNEIIVPFKNPDANISLKDLTFELSGTISKYTEIFPKAIDELGPKEEINLTIKVHSPTYIELGRQELVITIKGKKGVNNYLETKKLILEVHELSYEEAKDFLNKSEDLIIRLNQSNMSWIYLDELLEESKSAIEIFNYEKVRDNYNIIEKNVNNAIKTKDIITELKELITKANEKGIKTPDSSRLLKLSELSLERKDFETAYLRIKDAQLSYALETKGKIGKISYYVKEYPEQISLSLLIFFLFGFGTYKYSILENLKKKIKRFKKEEILINELISALQKETFKEKKMSMEEYKIAIEEYHHRMSEITQKLIELETKRVHLLKFTSKNKRLNREKNKIIELIKSLQEDYMKNKKIETTEYELKLESYNSRLTEIEEKLALLEAKKMSKLKITELFKNKK